MNFHDQAASLRTRRRTAVAASPDSGPPVIVIGSGKGGVGKSLVATAFAATMAHAGLRTLLVDGDQNLGNLHVLAGVRPDRSLSDVAEGTIDPADVLIPLGDNLWLFPADSGAEMLFGLGGTDRARLQQRISGLYPDYDAVVVDAGAGLDSATRCVTIQATRLIVVTIPEATALTDAYALIKIVSRQQPELPIDVLVNRATTPCEADGAFDRLLEAAHRFLARDLGYLGAIPDDTAVRSDLRFPERLLAPHTGGAALRAAAALAADCVGLSVTLTLEPNGSTE
ncbi:MAG: AAA family ATPase [Gemmatimonadota bacterium]